MMLLRPLALATLFTSLSACGTTGTLPCDHATAPEECPPTLWPCPKSTTMGTTNLTVDSTSFKFSGATHPDVVAAFGRYAGPDSLMFPHPVPKGQSDAAAGLSGCTVTVKNDTQILQLETDESYTLKVSADGCTIESETYVGALRAMETLSQLIMFNFDTQTYAISGAPVEIEDMPRFHHREVLVDTSRHFEPVETLKALIDSLTYGKINVIHWHLVDQQSFPFDSKKRPLLSQKGAYSPQERYTSLDVAEVVEYGRSRGVRMMVEIDGPGHAAIWCKGYPEICPSPTCLEPLNPATNATFELLDDLLDDLTGGVRGSGLFPDNIIHLGGDEVNTACYESTPSIASWLKKEGLTADGGYEYFVKKYQAIAHAKGRDVAGWEEIWHHFGTQLDKSTIIHQWLGGSTAMPNLTSHGYRGLWSTDGVWYLDGLKTSWQTMYTQEPCKGVAAENEHLVMGGGGEQWGETVDTSDIQQTIWPRLGAIGERLWSARTVNDTTTAEPRFAAFRCLLNRRAVAAAPYKNAQARSAPPGPGGCYDQ